ncbi:phosphoserine phosphatase SerB [Actinocorallia lasiicapitis]
MRSVHILDAVVSTSATAGSVSTSMERTLLITLTGRDRPGVTSRLFGTLTAFPVEVADVEQVVIRGNLVLGVLLTYSSGIDSLIDSVEKVADDLEMVVEMSTGGSKVPKSKKGKLHVTVLGSPLKPDAMAGVAGKIAAHGANIDRIERLASYPVTAIELAVSGADPKGLRAALATVAAELQVDIAVQKAGLIRKSKRLIVMDVDSTLIQGEVIELLAEHAGQLDKVAEITEAAMRGELDFEGSLRERVALLAGLDASAIDAVRDRIQLSSGARTLVRTLKRLDYKFAIVSGGFTQITDSLVADLGIDYSAANTLEVENGVLTGRVIGPIIDRAGKATALRRFAEAAGIPVSQTVAIGDGANDLDMLQAAGLGVAYNAKPVVRQAAHTAVNVPYLDTILFLLGISRAEIEAADAEDPTS